MKEKYYTPNIEEFHVGFEFEKTDPIIPGTWDKKVIEYGIHMRYLETSISAGTIRVKYLDEDDLLDLGFTEIDSSMTFELTGDDILTLDYFKKGKGWYLTYSENESQFGFGGWIKNRNELKKLLKQLNI